MKIRSIVLLGIGLVTGTAMPAQAPNTKIGAFTIAQSTDAMTDMKLVRAITESTESGRAASLEWRCQNSDPMIIYRFNVAFLGIEYKVASVQYRVDQSPASTPDSWWLSSGNRTVVIRSDSDSDKKKIQEFTDAVARGAKILIEVRDLDTNRTLRDTFNVTGLANALKKLDCVQPPAAAEPLKEKGSATPEFHSAWDVDNPFL